MEALSEKRTRKRRTICLLIAIPACVVTGLLFLMSVLLLQAAREKHPNLGMVSRITELKFPRGTVLVESKTSHGMGDCHLLAKIQMDRSEVAAFVMSLPKPRELVHWDVPGVADRPGLPRWWDPRSARKFREISIHRDEDKDSVREWRMLIRLDEARKAVLYLEFLEN